MRVDSRRSILVATKWCFRGTKFVQLVHTNVQLVTRFWDIVEQKFIVQNQQA